MIEYKIVSANAATGQITVKYFEGDVSFTYLIDVPIENGLFITGEKLHADIESRKPIWQFERIASLKTATNFNEIEAQVEV